MKNRLKKLLVSLSLLAMFFSVVGPAQAAIEATDYLQLTVAGGAVTMNSGNSLVFTINSLDVDGAANTLAGADYAIINIWPMGMGGGILGAAADVIAVGGGATLKASAANPWGGGTTAASIGAGNGTNDTLVAVNIDGTGTGTFTVTATQSFGVCVGANGAIHNSDMDATPGQECRQITVAAGAAAPDHLNATAAVTTAQLNQTFNVTLSQHNAGHGVDTTAFAGAGATVAVDGGGTAVITDVDANGDGDFIDAGENIDDAASIAGQALFNGQLTIRVKATAVGGGTLTVTPASPDGLDGVDEADTVTIDAAALTIKGYGPMNGQIGVPTNAPIDIMFSKDPDPNDTIFPLTNVVDSVLSLTTGGGAVDGQWNLFSEGWGEATFYRVAFQPDAPLTAATLYTVSISKAFVAATDLPMMMPALTDGLAAYSFTLTTGTGGGSFMMPPAGQEGAGGFSGGFTGTLGGEFPPMAFLSYPMPGMPSVPTNIACVTVGFDRPIQASTLTTSNIYIKKLTNGVESAPAGSPAVTALQGNESVCISGYTFAANTDYRVIVTRDVRDEKGTQLAGMPESNGTVLSTMGFGFANMGPFKEQFKTGAGAASAVAPTLMGLNINQYKSGASITGVPTGTIIRASFDSPLNPSTVNTTNVTLNMNGTVPVVGSVFYDAMGSSIEFVPSSILAASTSYTFTILAGVTSVSGTATSASSTTFTTGAADIVKPQVVYADADNYGVNIQFDEPLNETSATNKSFYTLKTCSQAAISLDPLGWSCAGGGSVTTVSLMSGVTAHYEKFDNSVWMDGLTLTAGDGFYIGVETGVTDITGNPVAVANNKSWIGFVMDAGNFAGGQGMFNMGTIGMEDFDMGMMGMNPISVQPMNTMASATTKYFINIPIGTAIPANGYIELTFPTGFGVTGVKQDAQSPMNNDFNGPSTGTVTFTSNDTTSVSTDTAGVANDGIGYIASARKVYIQLSAATQADDFLHIDIDGITNSSEPKSFDTSGYSVDIKTFNTSNALLEAMTTMPFFISSAGTGSVSGVVRVGEAGAGLNGVKVFLGSPMTGPMETTTSANGAGTLVAGENAGEYKFENLPSGQYFVFTEPMFHSGGTDYYGNMMPEPLTVPGATPKNISVTAATASGKATLPVNITFAALPAGSLGFNDSIDIFAFNPSSRTPVIKTVSRTDLGASPYSVNIFLPAAGDWNVGIGPAMPKGPMGGGMGMMGGGWMPPQNVNVTVAAADLEDAAEDLSDVTFAMSVSDKTITGKVLDDAGSAVANAEVYAYDPQAGKNSHTTATVDGSFTLDVTNGSYKVGAFLPGLSNSQETSVLVSGASFYVNGSATASTGSSGANPFNLKMTMPDYTIQGRVATGSSPIAGAAIWAHRTDVPSPPLYAGTDSSGNYTLYVDAGTWKVEGDAPNYGYLGSKTLTVSTASLSNQNFEVASDLNTVSGTINIPNTTDDSGTMVYAYGTNGSAEAKTDTSGNYTLNLPDGTYDIGAVIPGTGDLVPLDDVAVDGTEVGNDFVVATPRTFTVTLSTAVTEDTTVKFFGTGGEGNEILIPEGSTSGTAILPEGTYYLDADVPGVDFEDLVIAGAEFNNPNGVPGTADQINVDGAGAGATADNITITLPALYTLTGQVTSGGSGVNDVSVSFFDQSTQESWVTATSNNAAGGGLDGEYSMKLQAGTYSIFAGKAGYTAAPVDKVVSASSAGNNFALTASSRTITGTVSTGGVPIAGASVWAEQAGGGFQATEASTDGTYVLNVDPGIWTVNAGAEGYSQGTALNVDVTSASESLKNFSLTVLAGGDALEEPQTESITPGSGGTVIDESTNAAVIAPPNALGTSSDSGQLSIGETNDVYTTQTANPIGNGYEISATDADGNPIQTLDDDVTVSLQLPIAQLTADGIDTPAEAAGITNAYWDDNSGNWAPVSTDCIYYNVAGVVIPENTVAASGTLALAGVDHIEFISQVDHLTTFAPIIAVGATPPATPTGLAAAAGDSSATLTWTKNSEEDMSSYNIWEANVTEGISTTLAQATCGVATCSKAVSSLTNGTAYAFQIAAVDADGNVSAYASAVTVTPVAAIVAPGGGSPMTGGSSNKSTTNADDSATDDSASDDSASTEASEIAPVTSLSANVVSGQTLDIAASVTTTVSVQNSETKAYFTLEAGTEATTISGEAFSGGISAPAVISTDVLAPDKTTYASDVFEVGAAATDVTFSIPVKVVLPLNEGIDTSAKFAAYSLNEETSEWEYVADVVVKTLDGKYVAEFETTHFTKFAVMEVAEEEVEEVSAFEDVTDHWAKSFIEDLYNKGIVSGYEANRYGPDNLISRAEFTKVAIGAFAIPTLAADEIEFMPLTDISVSDWFAPYVQAAYVWHIVSGYEDSTFRPNQPINRAEALRILLDAADVDVSTTTYIADFPDIDADAWYAPYINYAAEKGIVSGYEDGTFGPEKYLTRGEVAKIVSIMLGSGNIGGVVGLILNMAT